MRRLCYILLLLSMTLVLHAQYHTRVMHSNIRTLRMQYLSEALEPSGNPQRPYLVLKDGIVDGSDEDNTLEISFDELSHDTKQYSYKVEHCDRYWNKSDISSYEYIDGFTTADIVDYELSNNTQQILCGIHFYDTTVYDIHAVHHDQFSWMSEEQRDALRFMRKRRPNYRLREVLRNPKIFLWFDKFKLKKLRKLYLFAVYDLIEYGFLYWCYRIFQKIKSKFKYTLSGR